MRRSGFTLMELLVVLGIVGLLTGLLLPVLVQARSQAQRTRCVAQLHQLGAAFSLYIADYDGRFPDYHADGKLGEGRMDPLRRHDRFCRGLRLEAGDLSFLSSLAPYLRSDGLGFCPADGERAAGGRSVTSYEYKLWLAEGRSEAEVPAPAGMALLWEQWAYHWGDGHASEFERRATMNLLSVAGDVRWRRLSDSSTARFGTGPDLHGLFHEARPHDPLYGRDFPD
ncbi:MAG: prepilin-type N-terminal cleavage/methylation domain-containing protein [Armatimonadetes bacterium]|nr:prepilin-type N-terminal cleavage/methylation domain-containing protein [Armatimonadota bacterium]